MFFQKAPAGYVLRVRLMPNSSSNQILGLMQTSVGEHCLKIAVTSIPEKGKANKALIELLAKELKMPKSAFEIISGETDRLKKILLRTNEFLEEELLRLMEKRK